MKLLLRNDIIPKGSRAGLLCNQTAWHRSSGNYLFESLAKRGVLKKVFIPEHGLFAELQDQEKLSDTSIYRNFSGSVEWITLYSESETSLSASAAQLSGIDTLIIDLQDTGSRYYTFVSTIWLLLKAISIHQLDIRIIVMDKPNPAGRRVEGTRISKTYASFIGIEGLPHRHGLTIGELCRYFRHRLEGEWELLIVPPRKKDYVFVPPSPNIPGLRTCELYSGQCLWEGTNLSEGRGTTLPFELTGAPFLEWIFIENWNNPGHPVYNKYAAIRPTRFIPVFHKHAHQTCNGFHLIVTEKKRYHSLAHSIRLMKFIKERSEEFAWKEGRYEAFNDRKAIELLAGDELILDYFENRADWKEVKYKMEKEEAAWIKTASPFLVYKSSLHQSKIK